MKLKLYQRGQHISILDENNNVINGVISVDFRANVNGSKLVIELTQFDVDIECDEPEIIYINKKGD